MLIITRRQNNIWQSLFSRNLRYGKCNKIIIGNLWVFKVLNVAKPRIELGFSASETLVLTIVRQGHKQNYEIAPITYRRNNTLIAAGRKIGVGKLLIIFKSSSKVDVLDKNLKTVAAVFFLNMRAKISSPAIF